MTRPNPHIALIYHYDLARALAGEVVDWQAIPVNVDAGREGGDLCRAAADFAKRRDLFAMPAPSNNGGRDEQRVDTVPVPLPVREDDQPDIRTLVHDPPVSQAPNLERPLDKVAVPTPPECTVRHICGEWGPRDHPALPDNWPMPPSCNLTHGHDGPHIGAFDITWTDKSAIPVGPMVEQPAAGGDGSAAKISPAVVEQIAAVIATLPTPHSVWRNELRDRIRELIRWHPEAETLLRQRWPDGVPTLKHDGHTDDQLEQILAAVRYVEKQVGADWVEGDVTSRSGAINRARKAWKDAGRSDDDMWFSATMIATYEQCRNPDATLDGLIRQFTIEQADRLYEQAINH